MLAGKHDHSKGFCNLMGRKGETAIKKPGSISCPAFIFL